MIQVNINNHLYKLLMADLYQDRFANYIHDDVIDFSDLSLEERYKKTDELFGFIIRPFIVVYGSAAEEEAEMAHREDILNICRRVEPVDRLQKYTYGKGNALKSIQIIEKFIEEILALCELMYTEEKAIKGR